MLAQEFAVNESEDVNLKCSFVGIPIPNIVWKYTKFGLNETTILSSEKFNITLTDSTDAEQGLFLVKSKLTIKNLTRNEEGNYQCSASNNVPNLLHVQASSIEFLTVQCKILE